MERTLRQLYFVFTAFFLVISSNILANEIYQTRVLTTGLMHPWSIVFLPDGQMLVSERVGNLKKISQDGKIITNMTHVPKVLAEGQGGLLGLALDPEFITNQTIYLAYAEPLDNEASTVVAKAKLNLKLNQLEDINVIFRQYPQYSGSNHFGSRLVFDKAEHLYITTGERFFQMKQAQFLNNHLGKVIRINKDGSIPADNPFVTQTHARPEIWSYGHRNIQGAAIHPTTGQLWIHEHGPKGGDEINISMPGKNYGWPNASYGIHYWLIPIKDEHKEQGYEEPIYYWTPSIAPSGMLFYSGKKFPQWKHHLLVGALAGRHLAKLKLTDNKIIKEDKLLTELSARIRDVAEDSSGYIYVLTDEADGKIIKLEPSQMNIEK